MTAIYSAPAMACPPLLRLLAITGIVLAITIARLPWMIAAAFRADRQHWQTAAGETITCCAEALGPVFVKFAQMVSYRVDLFPRSILRPIARLQDQVRPPRSFDVKSVVEVALDRPLREAFTMFDEVPVACGSVALVFRAITRDGKAVAIKVVRPGVPQQIERDLACFRWFVAITARFRFAKGMPFVSTFDTIATMIVAQADMLAESRNLALFQKHFCHEPGIKFPSPVLATVTQNALVMEYIDGAAPLRQADLTDDAFRTAADALLDALYAMIFTLGVVHCDMHPGNLLSRPDGAIALVDAGLVATLDDADRQCFQNFFVALASNDASECAVAILATALVVPEDFDEGAFRRDIDVLVRSYHGRRTGEFLVAEFVYRIFEIQRRHRLFGAPGFATAIWALVMFEGLVRERYPDLDFQAAARPFAVAAVIAAVRRTVFV